MTDAIETYTDDGVTVALYPDYDCPSPIDDRWSDQVGTLYSESGDIGKRLGDVYDMAAYIREERLEGYTVLPLRFSDYGGSGARIWETTPDDANAFYEVSRRDIEKEWNGNRAHARRYLRAIIEELDRYLQGDCYGYVVEAPEAGFDESCWGFIGEDYARSEMASVLAHARVTLDRERAERADMAARDIVTVD